MNKPNAGEFIVVCRLDREDDGEKGDFTLASKRTFATMKDAREYMKGINPSREAFVSKVQS